VKEALIVTLGVLALKKKLLGAIAVLALMVLPVTVCAPEAESATSQSPGVKSVLTAGASGGN
jgi:predicted cobalt transporter CbtA